MARAFSKEQGDEIRLANLIRWLREDSSEGNDIRLCAANELEGLTSKLDAERQAVLDLREQVAALQSREVCTAAHDDVEECGYCQRDRIALRLDAVQREAGKNSNLCGYCNNVLHIVTEGLSSMDGAAPDVERHLTEKEQEPCGTNFTSGNMDGCSCYRPKGHEGPHVGKGPYNSPSELEAVLTRYGIAHE